LAARQRWKICEKAALVFFDRKRVRDLVLFHMRSMYHNGHGLPPAAGSTAPPKAAAGSVSQCTTAP
jgi:hypothetical protein